MTTIVIPGSGINATSWLAPVVEGVRNGVAPPALAFRHAAERANALLARRGRVHFRKAISATAAHSSGTAADTWATCLHTGLAALELEVRMVLAPVALTAAAEPNPNLYWTTTPTGGAPTAQATVYYHRRDTATVVPDLLTHVSQTWTVTPDTEYLAVLKQEGVRVVACTIYERPRDSLDTASDTCVDPTPFAEGLPIHATQVSPLLTVTRDLWKRHGTPVFAWSRDSTTSQSTTSLTLVNVLDTGVSAWSSTSPGFVWPTRYHGRLESDGVPVTAWAYCSCGGAATITVRFTDGTTTIDLTRTSSALGLVTATGIFAGVSANATTKIDVQFKTDDITKGANVAACGMFEYEA